MRQCLMMMTIITSVNGLMMGIIFAW